LLATARLGPKRRKYVPLAVLLSTKDWAIKLADRGCKGGCVAEQSDVWTELRARQVEARKASMGLGDLVAAAEDFRKLRWQVRACSIRKACPLWVSHVELWRMCFWPEVVVALVRRLGLGAFALVHGGLRSCSAIS
jgi:hypothetical protein